jgi:RNA polymerase sigma factor (sigma-70 family)
MTEDILKASIRGERLAQKEFYNFFKGKMFVVCLRYAKNREDAEDMLQEGFIKVFQDLHQYAGAGSLEGWVRKVIVNVALQHLKKQQRLLPTVEFDNLEIADGRRPDTSPSRRGHGKKPDTHLASNAGWV